MSRHTSLRRTWDKQEYEQRARDRARREQQLEEKEERKRKGLKPKPADDILDEEGPRDLLTARTEKVVLDANLNRTQLIQSTSIASKIPGYYYLQNGVQAKYLSEQSIAQLEINHSDLIYITFEDGAKSGTSAVSAGKQPALTVGSFKPTTNINSSSTLNIKQEVVDDYLEKQSGLLSED
ncbi:10118_t:CDS:2, partial [Ambispora gerdemannii]